MHHEFDVGSLRGRRVIDNKGAQIGTIEDVSIDSQSWRVRGLVVEVDRDVADDIHLDKPLLRGRPTLSVTPDRISAMGENVILNVNRDDIAMLLRESDRR